MHNWTKYHHKNIFVYLNWAGFLFHSSSSDAGDYFRATDVTSHIVANMNSSEVMTYDMQPKVNIIPSTAWQPICKCRMGHYSYIKYIDEQWILRGHWFNRS